MADLNREIPDQISRGEILYTRIEDINPVGEDMNDKKIPSGFYVSKQNIQIGYSDDFQEKKKAFIPIALYPAQKGFIRRALLSASAGLYAKELYERRDEFTDYETVEFEGTSGSANEKPTKVIQDENGILLEGDPLTLNALFTTASYTVTPLPHDEEDSNVESE